MAVRHCRGVHATLAGRDLLGARNAVLKARDVVRARLYISPNLCLLCCKSTSVNCLAQEIIFHFTTRTGTLSRVALTACDLYAIALRLAAGAGLDEVAAVAAAQVPHCLDRLRLAQHRIRGFSP